MSGRVRRKPRRHSSASTALSSSSVICGRQLKTDAPRGSGRARLCSDQRSVGLSWVGGTRLKPRASSTGTSLSGQVVCHEGQHTCSPREVVGVGHGRLPAGGGGQTRRPAQAGARQDAAPPTSEPLVAPCCPATAQESRFRGSRWRFAASIARRAAGGERSLLEPPYREVA
eukprot:scaffold10143_cov120-Isochrysis_galbana.AAC.2